jgi:hypothetical protein
MGRVVKLFG